MAFPVALQLYSVRGDMERDFEGTLRAVKALGYDGVEFAGLFSRDPQEVRRLLDEIGLTALSAHVSDADILANPDVVLESYRTLGCRYIALPWSAPEDRPDGARFEDFLARVRRVGAMVKEYGMTLLYHNHDFEFVLVDGKPGLDVLYEKVDASLLQTELDACWVTVAGYDPAAYVRRYAGRAPIVHLKDFLLAGKKPDHLYALIGVDDEAAQEEPAGTFEFRPLGSGQVAIPEVIAAAKDAHTQWLVVEQDEPSLGKEPLACAQMSLSYLRSLSL